MAELPLGYLIAVVLYSLGTVLALRPPRKPRPLAAIGFRVGVSFSELPVVVLALLGVATAQALAGGNLDAPAGWAVLGLAIVCAAGLVEVTRRALLARPRVERALADELGPDWRTSLDAATAAQLRHRPSLLRIVLTPWPVRPRSVERIANISYGDAGQRNRLDVYRHRSRPSNAPILVYFHGGGYFSGRKSREARLLLHRLADRGWVCISANYRLRPAATFPDHLIDAKKAVAWARDQGRRYGADPAALFVAGSSAGGHLAALIALTADEPGFQPGFEHADTSVAAAICLYGYFGAYYGQGPATSPRAYVRPEAPPFFIAQGDHDTYSPQFLTIARTFVAELRKRSNQPVVYAELPGAQHAFDVFHSIRFEAVVAGIEAFAGWQLAKRAPASTARDGPRTPARSS
jgi:acetyl esterase/lipase